MPSPFVIKNRPFAGGNSESGTRHFATLKLSCSFQDNPTSSFLYEKKNEDTFTVQPLHVRNVQILWAGLKGRQCTSNNLVQCEAYGWLWQVYTVTSARRRLLGAT